MDLIVTVALLSFTFVPIAVGLAVSRYRLYDIDLIINHALLYAVLTTTLALVYAGSVVGLQYVFRASVAKSPPWRLSLPPSSSSPCSTRWGVASSRS